MGLFLWIVVGVACGYWSNVLAKEKGKPSPGGWAIVGFFFNVIPVIALYATHSKSEIQELLANKGVASSNQLEFTDFFLIADEFGSIKTKSGLLHISHFKDLNRDIKIPDNFESQEWIELDNHQIHVSHFKR